jgi:rubredoxin
MRGDRRDDPRTYGSLPPEAALALLGDEVRASILVELSEARGGEGAPAELSFSELRARVAPDVDSSRFNYHLQELVGVFVERRGDDGGSAQPVPTIVGDGAERGYALRPEGTTLARTIRAWTHRGEPTVDPFPVGQDCYFCGGTTEASYRNAVFAVQCRDCEYLYEYELAPPGVVGDDGAETAERAGQYLRDRRVAFARGACPGCGHGLETAFVDPAATGYPRADHRRLLVNRACPYCGERSYLRVGEALLGEPELVAFCHGRGLDVTRTPVWELPFAATDRSLTVHATDPWGATPGSDPEPVATLAVEAGGDALELAVDDDCEVVGVDRR